MGPVTALTEALAMLQELWLFTVFVWVVGSLADWRYARDRGFGVALVTSTAYVLGLLVLITAEYVLCSVIGPVGGPVLFVASLVTIFAWKRVVFWLMQTELDEPRTAVIVSTLPLWGVHVLSIVFGALPFGHV